MAKKIYIASIFISLFLASLSFAQQEEGNIPEWLQRVNYGVDIGSDQKPRWYFETVQPLYQTPAKDKTLFIQPRANSQGDDETFNLGIGYRFLTNEDKLLLGINTFYDCTTENRHYRVGVGLEAIGKVLEGRINTYFGLSDKRVVEETTTTRTYEEVVDGLDYELGGPFIPHMPWVKIYGSGYWFNHKHSSDREGWRLRVRLDPIKCVNADIIVWDDNKGDTEVRGDVSVRIPFDTWKDFKGAFKLSQEKYVDRDLTQEMLKRVERDYEVRIEKWAESKVGGATIEIKRAD